jgi:hypothetical protein
MYSWNKTEDRVAIVQMNAALRHAQLELLSAHCVTHQLRQRFSVEDLARYGQRDVLRKSVETARFLSEYYSSIQDKIPCEEETISMPVPELSEDKVREGIDLLSSWLRQQRERYFASAAPLPEQPKTVMGRYFSQSLLDRVWVVELEGRRLPNPPFYEEAKTFLANLPDLTHMASLTFLDVVVFNEKLAERPLFHALVHAVQMQVLGVERYAELFVRGFVNTKLHFTVPLEAHAFSLESKFVGPGHESFSVEDQVRLWLQQGRYEWKREPGSVLHNFSKNSQAEHEI